MAETTAPVTNKSFGDAVGCNFTTASRLRNGERMPSLQLFDRIVSAFDLDCQEALAAMREGREAFGRYLRQNVFGDE